MKKIVACFVGLVFLCMGAPSAQTLQPQADRSKIKFSIKNFGLKTNGNFAGLVGTIQFSFADPSTAKFLVSVDAATIETGIGSRDNHLKKADYFDVAHFPRISIQSTNVKPGAAKNQYVLTGQLTIKSRTLPITIPFQALQEKEGILFTGEFRLNRLDFGVGSSSVSLSDFVDVQLSIFAKQGL
jgi:polyisoprenoid-binding protein YceI